MFLYVYKMDMCYENIKNENFNKNIIFDKINDINNEIKGNVKIKNEKIPFILRFKSKFLFIITERKVLKRKALNILYNAFNKIDIFTPSFKKEKRLICEADDKQIKFFHNNNIEYSDELTDEYCDSGIIKEGYYFYEAKISFNNENKTIDFFYYGDSIKINENNQKELDFVLDKFESIMA